MRRAKARNPNGGRPTRQLSFQPLCWVRSHVQARAWRAADFISRLPVDSWWCPCSGPLGGPGAAASAARQQARSCSQSGTDGVAPADAEGLAHARPRLGGGEGTDDRDARRSGLAHAGAKPHRLHLLARFMDGAMTISQWFRYAEQGLTARSSGRMSAAAC